MNPNEMLDLIKGRRVVRRFEKSRPVDPEALDRILTAGLWSPLSVYGLDGRRFIALKGEVRDQAAKTILRDHTVLRYLRYRYEHAPMTNDEVWKTAASEFDEDLGGAPVIIMCLVAADEHKYGRRHNAGAAWTAVQNMMLQAEAERLHTGIISLGSRKTAVALLHQLDLDPDAWTFIAALNLGHSDDVPTAMERDREHILQVRG